MGCKYVPLSFFHNYISRGLKSHLKIGIIHQSAEIFPKPQLESKEKVMFNSKIEVLSKKDLDSIHKSSLQVLRDVGAKVENKMLLSMLRSVGCQIEKK